MIRNNKSDGKIFISYRREDSRDFAGRLSDTLEHYFGDNRVFQDIDDIAAGADFGDVLNTTLDSADAVIVLIGKQWLTCTDANGQLRLGKEDDWVTNEIMVTLEKGIPIYPVLIDYTPMPRDDELPEFLRPLARFNALSVSADRWHSDVTRLARSIALDIPSAIARKLALVNLITSFSLLVAIVFPTAIVAYNAWQAIILQQSGSQPGYLIEAWHLAVSFLLIVPCTALLFVFAREVDPARRKFFSAAAWTGALGSAISFILYKPVEGEANEAIMLYFFAVLVAATMLALTNLSGFKHK